MSLRWNPDGKGIRQVPPHLLQFARAKRQEFLINGAASSFGGLVLGRASAAFAGVEGALTMTTVSVCAVYLAATYLLLGIGISSLF